MRDQQAERIYLAAQELAIVVRDEGPDAVRRAAVKVLRAAGGDPVAALTIAAAAICIDHPADVWWQQERTEPLTVYRELQPCGTHAAHERHRANGDHIDDKCRAAEKAYQAEQYAQRQETAA